MRKSIISIGEFLISRSLYGDILIFFDELFLFLYSHPREDDDHISKKPSIDTNNYCFQYAKLFGVEEAVHRPLGDWKKW